MNAWLWPFEPAAYCRNTAVAEFCYHVVSEVNLYDTSNKVSKSLLVILCSFYGCWIFVSFFPVFNLHMFSLKEYLYRVYFV